MQASRQAHPYPSKAARFSGWPLLLLLACALVPAASRATCLADSDPEVLRLQQLIGQDGPRALTEIKSALESAQRDSLSDTSHNALRTASRIAALYAVEAEAYSVLELDAEARVAAEKGLALVTNAHDPVHLELLIAYSSAVYDDAGIAAAIQTIDATRSPKLTGPVADTCLLISRGLLEHRQGRDDLAIVTLTEAYRNSEGITSGDAATASEEHINSADYLSLVMRSMGDYTQALALNQEKIDWDTAHGSAMSLSVSRFMRGQILKQTGDYQGSITEFEKARKLSVSLGDPQGIAFADQRICEAHIELGQLNAAQGECESANRAFHTANSDNSVKETEVLQARIDLGLGHPELALAAMNRVLDRGGEDIPPRTVGSMYEWRAQANAALHDYRGAYNDLQQYVSRYKAANEAERIQQAGALRARFETDREIERNTSLKHELESSQERSTRQARELRWNSVVVVAGVWIIALLVYFLLANRSYRQQLVQLASQDPLTGLPNRRHTVELAVAALETARDSKQPLTIALIDMDHFKNINDRCGHAAGDHVLKEFARAGREALRSSDIMGRWGGEEFLLVMPETPLEYAIASLERLRTLVFGIRLPASGSGMRVSLSAGLASLDENVKSLEDLIARADAALYAAKNEGRDLIRLAEIDLETASTGVRRALRKSS
jgi:diguanylate cyclase (GGDEF)-like protein